MKKIVVDLREASEIVLSVKQIYPKTTIAETNIKENIKNEESFNKFDLLKDKNYQETESVSSKFDLLK